MVRQRWKGLVVALLIVLGSTCAFGQSYDPEGDAPPRNGHDPFTYNKWTVVPTPAGKGIKGWIRLDCYTDEYDEVFVRLDGLKPLGRYTVWLVDHIGHSDQDRSMVAQMWEGPRMHKCFFKADKEGRSYYHGWLQKCPLGKWRTMEVRYHPNGDVKDLDSSVVVCRVHVRGS